MPRPKTLREAIHGDISLLPHELDVINTRVFQRLHGIKQLGMAYMVYPTAMHTRFEHVLGCVHVTEQIIKQLRSLGTRITANPRELQQQPEQAGFPVSDELRKNIRMAALLHDLAHVPYGHTLESELGILKEHHEERLSRFIQLLTEEVRATSTQEADRVVALLEYALDVVKTVRIIDRAIKEGTPSKEISAPLPLHEWFVADIIGNTICADLLDYARRDMRTTGLNQDYDDRLYSYFDLAPDEYGRIRLALRVTKDQGLRLDAVSEVLHVLRIRYTLSERVLFHHTKNTASAMLGEALSCIKFGDEAFDELQDQQLLPWIRMQAENLGLDNETLDGVRRLVGALESRQLHKIAFRVDTSHQLPHQRATGVHLGEAYADPEQRQRLQSEIRTRIPQLRPGDVIIYCPKPQMTMKEVWVRVLARKGDRTARYLRAEADPNEPFLPRVVGDEVRALEEKYMALWSWTVVIAPEKLKYVFAVQRFIRDKLNVSNDPFLQSYWESQQDLQMSKDILDAAQGDIRVAAEAVQIHERALPEGPQTAEDAFTYVQEARSRVYPEG